MSSKDIKNIKIAIVDDHQLFSDALRNILPIYGVSEDIVIFLNGDDLLHHLNGNKIDLVLLDLGIKKGLNGFETLEILKKQKPNIKTIIISMHTQNEYVEKIKKMGANAYLSKDTGTEKLVDTMISVLENDTFYSNIKGDFNNPFNLLTKAEINIAKELFKGLSNSEIAEKIFRSTETISSHRKSIYRKLEVNNIVEFVKSGIKYGMITDSLQ